jgi:CheY-like chemotaxis protein
MTNTTVLIVDDDASFLEEVGETLEMSGFRTVVVNEGAAVCEAARRTMPDAILMDLKMKGVDGFSVSRKLKADPATADIPIIAMSGYFYGDEFLPMRSSCGIDHCLAKPFSAKQLLDCISRILEMRMGATQSKVHDQPLEGVGRTRVRGGSDPKRRRA